MKILFNRTRGFTLMEILVVIAIIGILSSIILFSVSEARANARDKQRMADLKSLELALALYYEINGEYPDQGCGAVDRWTGPGVIDTGYQRPLDQPDGCDEYIDGLVPNFIQALPLDPKFEDDASHPGWGYLYKTTAGAGAKRTSYKLLVHMSVEKNLLKSNDDDFARRSNDCPAASLYNLDPFQPDVYAVYGGSDGTNTGSDSACW